MGQQGPMTNWTKRLKQYNNKNKTNKCLKNKEKS